MNKAFASDTWRVWHAWVTYLSRTACTLNNWNNDIQMNGWVNSIGRDLFVPENLSGWSHEPNLRNHFTGINQETEKTNMYNNTANLLILYTPRLCIYLHIDIKCAPFHIVLEYMTVLLLCFWVFLLLAYFHESAFNYKYLMHFR